MSAINEFYKDFFLKIVPTGLALFFLALFAKTMLLMWFGVYLDMGILAILAGIIMLAVSKKYYRKYEKAARNELEDKSKEKGDATIYPKSGQGSTDRED